MADPGYDLSGWDMDFVNGGKGGGVGRKSLEMLTVESKSSFKRVLAIFLALGKNIVNRQHNRV